MTGQKLFDAFEPLIRIAMETKEIQQYRKFRIKKLPLAFHDRESVWKLYCPFDNSWIPAYSFERAIRFLGYELNYHINPDHAADHSDLD